MIGNGPLLVQKERQRHTPPGLGGRVGVFLGGGGITGDVNRPGATATGGSGIGGREGEGNSGEGRCGDLSAGK